MVYAAEAAIARDLPIALGNVIVTRAMCWWIVRDLSPYLEFAFPVTAPHEVLITLPVLLSALAVLDVFHSFPLLGVEAAGLAFATRVGD